MLAERFLPTGQTLQLVQGDLTAETTDAIVNAANSHLQHGGGVAGAISRRGGPAIQQQSDEWVRTHGPVTHEHPAWTRGGQLSAKYVIHAVGPVWGDGNEDAKLASAIEGALTATEELGCESISMPALSTGIFGFPRERAARVILSTVRTHFSGRPSGLKVVRIVLFDPPSAEVFLAAWGAG
ncbi:MAG TPA: macro domain-containing protein [Anaerolineales bacterium]|nr:macro domain-containing protein [Anaerolineales bacterium]